MAESYPKQVENTVGKGEITRYEQFLLFPQCFQKACLQGASKGVIVSGWVNTCAFCKIFCISWMDLVNGILWFMLLLFPRINRSGAYKFW